MKRKTKSTSNSLPRRAARMLAKLKSVRGLTDAEKSVYALGLAATPEERWELNEKFVRSLGYWKPLRKKQSANIRRSSRGLKSKAAKTRGQT